MAVNKKTSSRNPTYEFQNDKGQIPIGGNQQDYIQRLLAMLNGDGLSQLLVQLGIDTGQMNAGETQDWNKQIMDALLQRMLQNEQRNYNKDVLNEQRIYDSPTNQLARLMGAGISRDAALQLLGGSGSGAGSGSALIADPMQLPASAIPATQSDLNAVQKDTAIANAVFGGISAVSGLVSLGISIPSAIAQTTALSIQNAMSQKALIGLQSADSVMSALENAVQVGVLSTKDVDGFSNATDALNYIQDHKDIAAFKGLFSNGSFANVYGTKLGREMFAQAWKNVRSSKDDGTILDEYIRNQKLQNTLAELQTDQIGAEIQKLGAETEAVYQDMLESCKRIAQMDAQILVLNKQGEWIDIQKKWQPKVWQAEINKTDAEINSLNTQTAINQDVFEVNHSGVPILKQKYLDDLELAAYKSATLNSPESRKQFWQAWAMEGENAHALAFMQNCYYNSVGDFATQYPETWKLSVGLKYSGAYDGIKTGTETAGAVGAAIKTLPKIIP